MTFVSIQVHHPIYNVVVVVVVVIGQAGALGLLAISSLRMKVFWSPYMCVLASTAVADTSLWTIIARKVDTISLSV